MTKTVKAQLCTCDYDDCQNVWVALVVPERCGRCKRRRWNKGGFSDTPAPKTQPRRSERGGGASQTTKRRVVA